MEDGPYKNTRSSSVGGQQIKDQVSHGEPLVSDTAAIPKSVKKNKVRRKSSLGKKGKKSDSSETSAPKDIRSYFSHTAEGEQEYWSDQIFRSVDSQDNLGVNAYSQGLAGETVNHLESISPSTYCARPLFGGCHVQEELTALRQQSPCSKLAKILPI